MSDQSTIEVKSPEKHTGTQIGSLTDLGYGLVDSAVARPYNATVGLVLPKLDLSHAYNHRSIAGQIGDFGGSVADVVLLSKITGGLVNKGLGRAAEGGLISSSLAESRMFSSTLSMGTTGALYGGVFTPGTASERLKNATVNLATFSTLGATTAKFDLAGKAGSRTLFQSMKVGGLSGIPAGIVDAEATSLVNGRGFNYNPVEVGKSALYYGLFGATMNGVAHGFSEAIPKTRMWLSESQSSKKTPAPVESLSPKTARAAASEIQVEHGKQFNIPETGMIDLGKMIQESAAGDRTALIQAVIKSRPQVPMGSWMRLIQPADMETFLKAGHELFPDTALRNANYLIERRMMRPPTPESPPVDFEAWERALKNVQSETSKPPKPSPEEVVPELGKAAKKPFAFEDVTMKVKNPDLLQKAIANNADTELGTKVLNFANRWATIMEEKMAAGQPLTADMARQASLETKLDVRNYEYDIARNVLVDTWEHGASLDRACPLPEGAVRRGSVERVDEKAPLSPELQTDLNNFGSMLQTVARSRADAINIVRGMDTANINPAVREALLDHLLESQTFLRQMGVDNTESVLSIVRSMKNVPESEIPRFVHYADQFHHQTFPNSVMSGMDQAVAGGNIREGTQQAWIDAISAKMRIVFPGIAESEWAISKLKKP